MTPIETTKRAGTVVLLLCALAARGVDASAQTGTMPTVAFEADAKSPWTAGVLEAFIPTLGYGYADSWSDGIVPGVVRLGGAVAMLWGVTERLSREPGDPDVGEGCSKKCTWGFAVMAVGAVWGVVGAVSAANDASEPQGLGVVPTQAHAARGVSIGFRIGF